MCIEENFYRRPAVAARFKQIDEIFTHKVKLYDWETRVAKALEIGMNEMNSWIRGRVPAGWEVRLIYAVEQVEADFVVEMQDRHQVLKDMRRWMIESPTPPAPQPPQMPAPMPARRRATEAA